MTAKKRFHYYPKSQMIVDVFTGKRYFGHDAICKLLNILYEENEELKQYIDHIHSLYENTHGINMENEEWWQDD